MNKYSTLRYKVSARLARKNCNVFVRDDFKDLGGYDQVGRVLRSLESGGKLIRLGYGIYAKARKSTLTGEVIPVAPLPVLAREALSRLGLEISVAQLEKDYNDGKTTQVPTGRQIAVKGRISRKIGYKGTMISYERAS
jgi:Family of unknown function (DUF6088)